MPALVPSDQSNPGYAQRWEWLRPFGYLLGLAGLTIWFFSPVTQVTDPTLDHSNYASFAYFTAHGFQYGADVMHVGGPYGFVHYGFIYGGNLFWKRFPLELLTKLVLSALVLWFFARARGSMKGWWWLPMVLFLVPLVEDLGYDLGVLLGGLGLLACHARPGLRARLVGAGLAVFLAFLTLMKGTHAVLSLATFGLLFLQAWQLRDLRRVALIALAYVAALIALLFAAGQNPLNFPTYLRSIIEQSSGYNAAMALDEPRATFLAGCGALVALELVIFLGLVGRWRNPCQLTGALLLAGFSFVEWKHGFVRADGHVYIFFQYACIAAPTALLFTPPAENLHAGFFRWLRIGLSAVTVALGAWGGGWQSLGRYEWGARQLPRTLARSFDQILRPTAAKARLDAELTAARFTYRLPRIRELVGDDRVDFFGTAHGYLTLNRLNYRPRPMGGGNFSVFNAWLRDANRRFITDEAMAPRFILTRVETFDSHFLAQDDGGTLLALLALYQPIEAEQGMVLFERRAPAPTLPSPRLIGTKPIHFEETIVPPPVRENEMLAMELSLPLSPLGKLRSAAYKAPQVFMTLSGEGIENPVYRRVIPAMFERPVILNPVIENTEDVVALYHEGSGKQTRSLRLDTPNAALFSGANFEIRFYAVPRPAPAASAALIERNLSFPIASRTPQSFSPTNSPLRWFDGLLVKMFEPPGRIRFKLRERESQIEFSFGIDPVAYTRGKTDGVKFLVDLERPGQAPMTIFSRYLKPLETTADQGEQFARIVLPPFPLGSGLSIRTDAGSDGDGAWDWAYLTGIRLWGDGYIPEQFPRFSTLPTTVLGEMTGVLPWRGRDLFMLNSPGSLTFELKGSERRLKFAAGLLDAAYTGDARSDGVDVIVDLLQPDGKSRRIFQHLINPRDVPEDRGDCAFTLDLPSLPVGSKLVLSVGPGPSGSHAWDWAYIESLQFD